MPPPTTPPAWRHDTALDRWLRRYGHWAAILVCAGAILLVPADSTAPQWATGLLAHLPALRSLMDSTGSSGRLVMWVVASVLLSPLIIGAARSRIRQVEATDITLRAAAPTLVAITLILSSYAVLLCTDLSAPGSGLALAIHDTLRASPVAAALTGAALSSTGVFFLAALYATVSALVSRQHQAVSAISIG